MSSKFWWVKEPIYNSLRESVFVNGEIVHKWSIPGIDCPQCGTWGGGRVVPIECPRILRTNKSLMSRWPIKLNDHNQLTESVRVAAKCDFRFQPGDFLQPCTVSLSSFPESDFLWSPYTLLASDRVCVLFRSHGVRGIDYCSVTVDRIGSRVSCGPIPGIHSHSASIAQTKSFGSERALKLSFSELIVLTESGPFPGTERVPRCNLCGRYDFDPDNDPRQFILTRENIPSANMFVLSNTSFLVCDEKVKNLIIDNNFANVNFEEIVVGQKINFIA